MTTSDDFWVNSNVILCIGWDGEGVEIVTSCTFQSHPNWILILSGAHQNLYQSSPYPAISDDFLTDLNSLITCIGRDGEGLEIIISTHFRSHPNLNLNLIQSSPKLIPTLTTPNGYILGPLQQALEIINSIHFKQIRVAYHPEVHVSKVGDKCQCCHLQHAINWLTKASKGFTPGPHLSLDKGDRASHFRFNPMQQYNNDKLQNVG